MSLFYCCKTVFIRANISICRKTNEISLPAKQSFYSHLNMVGITNADCTYEKRVFKDFRMYNLEEYHDLYI